MINVVEGIESARRACTVVLDIIDITKDGVCGSEDGVVTGISCEDNGIDFIGIGIGSCGTAAIDHIVTRAAHKDVITCQASDGVISSEAIDLVIA